jgi:hypothetical protein
VLAVGQRDEDVAAAGEPPVVEKQPVIYLVDQNGLAVLADPRTEGENDAPATLQAASTTIAGVADATSGAGAMAYDLRRDLLYLGTANGLAETDAGIDRFVRWDPHGGQSGRGAVVSDTPGFSMVGGIGLRNDGRILLVDDRALLDPAEPLGEGLMYQIGNPAARVTSGPSDPENDALDPSYTSSRTPSFALAGDTPRTCWLRPASSTAAPSWQSCDAATYTTPSLADGTYKLTVRAKAPATAARSASRTWTVDATAGRWRAARRSTAATSGSGSTRCTSSRPTPTATSRRHRGASASCSPARPTRRCRPRSPRPRCVSAVCR